MSEIWQMIAALLMKEGNFREAFSMEENTSFSEVRVEVGIEEERGVRGTDDGD